MLILVGKMLILIEEEVYVCQPPGFEDPDHPDKVYKVVKAFLWTAFKLQELDVKSASTPTDLEKPLVQDGDATDVDEHLYRSMIGSLMYLTASRPDIMFIFLQKGFDAGLILVLVSKLLDYAQSLMPISVRTAEASTDTNGEEIITAIIDGQSKAITEASLRRHLKLDDHDGITFIPNSEIFEQLALMGYQPDSDKLTFQKDMQKKQLKTHSNTYPVPSLNNKVFSNMRRLTKGYTWVEIQLFPTMLTSPQPEPSPPPSSLPSRITSSHSLSSEPSTASTFEPQPSPDAEIGVLEDDLKKTKQTYSSAFTKLILRIKKLESKVKNRKARKRARVVLLEDEEDDSSKQRRIDEDPNTYFAQDDEVVHDQDTAAERQLEDSTAGITVSTAPINISTARESHSTAGRVVYGRRSKEARKDKGKEIMTEPEPVKKSKKLLEQERQGLEEAIRLQKQVDEEEKAQIARDEEIARQLLALDEERVTTDPKTTKDIDWNDPSVQKYWNLKNKPKSEAQARKNMIVYLKNQSNYKMKDFEGMSYDEIRPIFEKVWDFNHNFVPMEIEKEKKKPAEFQEIEIEQIEKDTTGKRKKSLPRKRTRSTTKRQKVELEDEKEDLKGYLDIIPREDVAVNVDSLSTKYPIMDWKTYTLSENFMLVKERYSSSKPEGYDLMLWGDLHTLFEPDEESEIWMNQNEYNLISWSLCDFCGVHILLMQNGIAIHMLTEKKYPLSQEMISKMLSKRLEVDQESTQAYELLKFIRSQVKK
ncbi:ribonuclease H-like domain-containing protein [Tanacetum coccineum]